MEDSRMIRLVLAASLAFCLTACENKYEVAGFKAFEKQVTSKRVGYGSDQWIEMKNGIGEWERVGLIFGYSDDYAECIKALRGLQQANEGREYRCVPAN